MAKCWHENVNLTKVNQNSKVFRITIGLQEMSFLGADAVMKSNTNFEAKFELEQPVIGLCF